MPDCMSAYDTPFLPVTDAKLVNDLITITSAATLLSPSLFFVRLGLLAAPYKVNGWPPELAAK